MRALAEKARKDARVKEYLDRKMRLRAYAYLMLFCELRRRGVKMKMVACEHELPELLKVIGNLAKDLKARTVGYKLRSDLEKLEIEDIEAVGEEVYVFFSPILLLCHEALLSSG